MQILETTYVWEWLRGHGLPVDGDDVPLDPLDDPALTHRRRVLFALHGPRGLEGAVADALLAALGPWDRCLLSVTGWGVWMYAEDWPRFYALRGRHGCRMSLADAPGHLLSAGEPDARDLLLQVLENGWDAALVPALDGRATDTRVLISHDGWAEIRSARPVDPAAVAGLPSD